MDCDDEVFKWLEHALTLKTERGIRSSIARLRDAIIDYEIECKKYENYAKTYQKATLEFLMNTMNVSESITSVEITK